MIVAQMQNPDTNGTSQQLLERTTLTWLTMILQPSKNHETFGENKVRKIHT